MKIGITCYPTYGGSGVVATELGISLAKRGHEVHFISYAHPFRLPHFERNIFFHEVDINTYPVFKFPPYTLALASKMAEIAKDIALDIFHVHYAVPHAVCAYLAKEMLGGNSPKIVTTLHGTDITLVGSNQTFYGITKFAMEKSDAVTAVSEYLANRTKEVFGVDIKMKVIPNFVDTDKFKPDDGKINCKDFFGFRGERKIIHISNFRPVKRVCDVIRVFEVVSKKVDSTLIMVGDGPDFNLAKKLALSLGISDRVNFVGKQDSVQELLSISDLMIFPSEEESFGLAALEALSCGVPVVGTQRGGIPEVVAHGKNGFLHSLGDIEGMAESAVSILTDDGLFCSMRKNAREEAILKFNSEKIVPLYEELYKRLM